MNCMSRSALIASALFGTLNITSAQAQVSDPLEPINRGFFALNELLDTVAFKPIATVYNTVLPKPVRTGVSNVFSNLDDAFISVNHALQGRGKDSANSFGRVLINSTIGLGGLFDIATDQGLQKGEGDFGQTLGVWGVGAGPYMVLPVLGPSNVRETVGRAARMASDPRNALPDVWAYSLIGTEFVQYKADNLENLNLLDSSSLDKYGFMRTVYMQRRESLVTSGRAAAGAP